jgi:hypothetical protein
MSLKESVASLTEDARVAYGTAGATTATGAGTFLDVIPDDIGKLASCFGIVLSIVLIYTHIRKGAAEFNKIRLETEELKKRMSK